jgi:hypothetical protein
LTLGPRAAVASAWCDEDTRARSIDLPDVTLQQAIEEAGSSGSLCMIRRERERLQARGVEAANDLHNLQAAIQSQVLLLAQQSRREGNGIKCLELM